MIPHKTHSSLPSPSASFPLCLLPSAPAKPVRPPSADTADKQGLKPILNYIANAWDTLTRSMTNCESIVDPKIADTPVLYLPAGFDEPPAVHELSGKCKVRVEPLPKRIEHLGEITTG